MLLGSSVCTLATHVTYGCGGYSMSAMWVVASMNGRNGWEWAENPKSNIAWKEVGVYTWGSRVVGRSWILY